MPETITLGTLGKGGLEEAFQSALEKVLANIYDPNVKAIAVRRIAINLTWKPNKDREVANLDYSVEPILAKAEAASTQVYMQEKHSEPGKIAAYEINPAQIQMFDENDPDEDEAKLNKVFNNVTKLQQKKG